MASSKLFEFKRLFASSKHFSAISTSCSCKHSLANVFPNTLIHLIHNSFSNSLTCLILSCTLRPSYSICHSSCQPSNIPVFPNLISDFLKGNPAKCEGYCKLISLLSQYEHEVLIAYLWVVAGLCTAQSHTFLTRCCIWHD